MDFVNLYYKNITKMVKIVPDYFIQEEIIEKLVPNLNYSIDKLNGRNSLKIKVKDMSSINFNPK